ncbi:MAG TPA: PspC domain-containing protein [Candidatus Saccharimonadia bacterium]|nr:PspC domain-containing protein [Candidatus Saccharimonadia bacterium]
MNEVTKIHLGRQAFTVSAEAYKELRAYLDAIKKEVRDNSVVDEVELRMAELLAEHGVTDEKVILPADVDFLKEQLGNPVDFKEDGDDESAKNAHSPETKRLFRDTDDAMLAGVAAGLGKYFGVDALLIRLIFVLGIFTGGWGIVIYLVLWLLVPEAKTSSDRLQMAGKPVTIDSLKEVVDRADVKGAAQRANNSLAGPINRFFNLLLKLVGIGFIFVGLSGLLGLLAGVSYLIVHSGSLLQDNIFPIGLKEHLLLYITMSVVAIGSLFIVLFGMAMFMRKWPIRGWITGVLIGLAFIGTAAGAALAADTVPTVKDRYDANLHTTLRTLQPFSSVNVDGKNVDVRFRTASSYSISIRYYDHPNLANVKTTVSNNALQIDSSQFDSDRHCQTWCIPNDYNVVVTVNAPNADQLIPDMPVPVTTPTPIKPPVPPTVYNN